MTGAGTFPEERRRAAAATVRRLRQERAEEADRARERAARYRAAGHAVESWLGRLLVFGDFMEEERDDGGLVRTFAGGSSLVLVVENGIGERVPPGTRGDLVPLLLDHREELLLGFAAVERDDLGLLVRLDLAEPAPRGFGLSGGFLDWTTERVAERVEEGRVVEVRRLVSATVAEVSLVSEAGFPQSRLLRRTLRPRERALVRAMRAGA